MAEVSMITCPVCQTANLDGARFCSNCGSPLEAPRAVESERKRITVLFADVVGSTAMAERLEDPEQFAELMSGAFAFMNAAVERYEGTVARLMGDALLALFGAPVAHEDDAERAVRTALEIRDAAAVYADAVRTQYGVDFQVRVGINTGLVVAGMDRLEEGAAYTAMGDTPNVAARLQSAAGPGGVLISESTYRLVKPLFDVRPRGGLEVKGKSAPVESYEVLQPKAVPGSVRGLEGIHSPLVGRDAELRLLEESVAALRQGKGGFVAVLGEAGLGKSRLVAEVREHEDPEQLRWLEGRALSYGQSLLYYPWRQVIRQAIGVRATDPPETVRATLQQGTCTCCRLPGGDLPFLETILAVESEESLQALAQVEGDDLIERTADAMQGYLCSLARHQPTVVVFDDLHWGDPASVELLVRTGEVVKNHPLLLLCVLRPDKEAPSWTMLERARQALGEDYAEISLATLDPHHSRELLGNLLHVEDLPDSMRLVILKKSEGNPFFLEEVLRSLIDSGHIVRENGHWRATSDIVNVEIPATLSGVLTARIDRLEDEPKRVAQTAAVLGRIFAYRVLTEICATAPPPERIENVDPHLDTLTYEELVRERAHDPEIEYIFKHALTQEAAYELLLMRRRRELHRRAGEALERLYTEQVEEIAPMLARHFSLGEEWERAVEYSMRAGARAVKVYALQEALEHYQHALDALKKLPKPPLQKQVDTLLAWTDVAVKRRMHENLERRREMLERLDRAEQSVRRLDDKRRLTQVLVAKGNVLTLSGFPDTAFLMLHEASDLASELGDEELFLLPFFLATMNMVNEDPRAGGDQLERVIEQARKHRDKGIEAHALALRAMAHARLGEFAQAQRVIEQALEIAPATNSAIKEADVHIAAGSVYYDLGDIQRGLEHSSKGAQQALAVNGLECACAGFAGTGFGNLLADRTREALRAYEEALELGKETSMEIFVNQVHAGHAIAQFANGQTDAVGDLEQRLQNARKAGDEYGIAYIARALGEANLQLGRFEEAEQHFATAIAYYRRNNMRPYLAGALPSLATVYDWLGQNADAEKARTEAEALTRELQLA